MVALMLRGCDENRADGRGVLAEYSAGAATALELEIGHRGQRLAECFEVSRADVLDELVGRTRRHPQRLLGLRGRLAGLELLRDRDGVAQAADHVVDQPADALALAAQLEQQFERRGAVA